MRWDGKLRWAGDGKWWDGWKDNISPITMILSFTIHFPNYEIRDGCWDKWQSNINHLTISYLTILQSIINHLISLLQSQECQLGYFYNLLQHLGWGSQNQKIDDYGSKMWWMKCLQHPQNQIHPPLIMYCGEMVERDEKRWLKEMVIFFKSHLINHHLINQPTTISPTISSHLFQPSYQLTFEGCKESTSERFIKIGEGYDHKITSWPDMKSFLILHCKITIWGGRDA